MYIINKRGPLSTKEWIQATETEPFSADLIDFKHDPLGNHIPRKTIQMGRNAGSLRSGQVSYTPRKYMICPH